MVAASRWSRMTLASVNELEMTKSAVMPNTLPYSTGQRMGKTTRLSLIGQCVGGFRSDHAEYVGGQRFSRSASLTSIRHCDVLRLTKPGDGAGSGGFSSYFDLKKSGRGGP
jgi:hypothetical protein